MNLFYELADTMVCKRPDGQKYLAQYGLKLNRVMDPATFEMVDTLNYNRRALWYSDRVWLEGDTEVKYFKNRFTGDDTVVDMKEFMWIKLKAQTL